METKEKLTDEEIEQVSGGVITTVDVGTDVPDSELVDGTSFVGDGYVYIYETGFKD